MSSSYTEEAKESTSSTCVSAPKLSSPGSKTPDSPSGCRSPGSSVGEELCPICLGSYTEKCAAGSCFHYFCLVCLKEWAKQKPVCPLCKQSFTKILYDIKSETDYKEWRVPVSKVPEFNDPNLYFGPLHRRFFRYRSTLPWLHNYRRMGRSSLVSTDVLPSVTPSSLQRFLFNERGSSIFRLSIYTNNVWIEPISDVTGRYRESRPQLYREQPALTHRLVPWVNRELAALLPITRIAVVLTEIMDFIERYPINSREFRHAIRPYLGSRARHFAHEFYHFARSPYDLVGHDNAAQYVPRYENPDESNDDLNEVIEIDSDEALDLSSRVGREETLTNDGLYVVSSDSDQSRDTRNSTSATNNRLQVDVDVDVHFTESNFPSRETHIGVTCDPTTSSIPGTHAEGSSRYVNSYSVALSVPGPSGLSSNSGFYVKSETSLLHNVSDSDDCFVVDVLKPRHERSPEIINLSSDSDVCASRKRNKPNGSKPKIKASDRSQHKASAKQKKGRKKPRLDRTKFSLHFSGTLNCQHGEDHNYCSESSVSTPNQRDTINDYSGHLDCVNDNIRRSSLKHPQTRRKKNRPSSSSSEEQYYVRLRNSLSRSANSVSSRTRTSSKKCSKGDKSKIKSSSKVITTSRTSNDSNHSQIKRSRYETNSQSKSREWRDFERRKYKAKKRTEHSSGRSRISDSSTSSYSSSDSEQSVVNVSRSVSSATTSSTKSSFVSSSSTDSESISSFTESSSSDDSNTRRKHKKSFETRSRIVSSREGQSSRKPCYRES